MNHMLDFDVKWYPKYYSFITLRLERFGALVFNPYTGSELELTREEASIARQFNGENSLAEIISNCTGMYCLTFLAARQKANSVVQKLIGIGAVKLHAQRQIPILLECNEESNKPYGWEHPLYRAPKSAIWDITYLCNLKCPHCLTSSGSKRNGELTTEDAFKLMDVLAEAKLLTLSLSGGEPFLRKDIAELIAYAAQKNIRTDIASNGVELDHRILYKLRNLPLFQVQVSIDGIGEKHDAFRGRKGAFASVLANIKILKEEGISVSVSTTATKDNFNCIAEIVDLAAEMGCNAYKAIPFLPAGRGKEKRNLVLSPQHYMNLCQTLLEKAEKYAGRMKIATETTFAFLLTEKPPQENLQGYMGCSAGHDTLSIGADGTAYPCPFLQVLPLGNLLQTSLKELWRSSSILRELRGISKDMLASPCKMCKFAPLYCRGGCRASALFNSGSLYGYDPMCPACNPVISQQYNA